MTPLSPFKFNRLELAGSLGDLGTLIPLVVGLILLCDLSVTAVFLTIGLFYIASGIFFRLPMPVQPLKLVSAVAIASPSLVNTPVLAASALVFGLFLLFLAVTRMIDKIAVLFSKPIVRGIQLGLGLILIKKAFGFVIAPYLFGFTGISTTEFSGMSLNLILGIVGSVVALLLISNKRFPAALVIVVVGLIIGAVYSEFNAVPLAFGPTEIRFSWPTADNFLVAITLLVIPQIPLTVGNAIIGTHETCIALFDSEMTGRVSNQNLTLSMGLANLVIGLVGGVPLCHGAGGMAAHYRFGARSGGSNIMIGAIFIFIALAFGTIGIALLSALPNAVLGILLLFAGLELAMLVRDLTTKADLFVTVLIASLGFITTNMSVAFVIGIAVSLLIRFARIKL